ncbi:hypothetical protein GCM10010124_20580 [Pilimelia terevasa]|uniref:Antitoxin Xre/MbcA/ParS-like toxin-binding domain-containing protein n=1 Tax=Pilimelia terevasa TaxID=53372 RepID=A0A8J3BKM2_9ACTN|nr:hypothetical protein [Pilimelia terevasa]GGK27898.1 hypothetical protein GCM10010124_20580 [Pilimelia terevasa]
MTISAEVPAFPGAAPDGIGVREPDTSRHPIPGEEAVTDGHASAVAFDHAVEVIDDLGTALAETSEWLGTPLATYVSGAAGTAELSGWIESGPAVAASKEALARLQTAVEVIDIFAAVNRPTDAKAWLREVSTETVGRSPAQLLRYARHERLLGQIRHAATRHAHDTRD